MENNYKVEKLRDEDNWDTWKLVVSNLLEDDDGSMLEVCKGELKRSEDAETMKRFTKADKAARKILVTTLDSKPLRLITSCTTAMQMWNKLHATYEMKSTESLSLLMQQFYEFKWDNDANVMENLTKIENLVTKMKQQEGKMTNEMIVGRVMSSLPFKFNHFHSAWDSVSNTEKTMENLMARLQKEELRINKQAEEDDVSVALMTSKMRKTNFDRKTNQKFDNVKQQNRKKGGKIPKCANCKLLGHDAKNCKGCFNCGSKEHMKRDCPGIGGNKVTPSEKVSFLSTEGYKGSSTNSLDSWVIDSGATDHMTHRRDCFATYEDFATPITVRCSNGELMDVYGKGSINIDSRVNDKWIGGVLQNVLFVPDLESDLFGSKVAAKKGIDVQVTNFGKNLVFTKNGKVVASGKDVGNLYLIDIRVQLPLKCYLTNKVDTLQLWHERFCHQNKKHVKVFLKNLGIDVMISNEFCDGCAYGKHHRSKFGDRIERATKARQIIHTDVCGPMEIESINKKRYSVVFKDEFSGFRHIYFMHQKSEVFYYLKIFCNEIKNSFNEHVKEIQSDGGKEYNNGQVKNFLNEMGIKHKMTIPYTPE